MAILMTIRREAAPTRTEGATFRVILSAPPVISEGMSEADLQAAADRVILAEMEEGKVIGFADLIHMLMNDYHMTAADVLAALPTGKIDESLILHV